MNNECHYPKEVCWLAMNLLCNFWTRTCSSVPGRLKIAQKSACVGAKNLDSYGRTMHILWSEKGRKESVQFWPGKNHTLKHTSYVHLHHAAILQNRSSSL